MTVVGFVVIVAVLDLILLSLVVGVAVALLVPLRHRTPRLSDEDGRAGDRGRGVDPTARPGPGLPGWRTTWKLKDRGVPTGGPAPASPPI